MKFLPSILFFVAATSLFATPAATPIKPGVVVTEPKVVSPSPAPAPTAVKVTPHQVPLETGPKIIKPAGKIVRPTLILPKGEEAVKLQIFLDQSLFGPGVIDGNPGLFTKLAVAGWNESHGYPKDVWTFILEAAQKAVPETYTQATVPSVVKSWVISSIPKDRAEQAKLKRMSYTSVLEFMSERFHTSQEFLAKLNPKLKLSKLKAGDTLTVPNVQPFLIESITGARYGADPKLSERFVVIDTKAHQARIYEGQPRAVAVSENPEEAVVTANSNLVAIFPITPGKPKFIRYGMWKMKNCVEFPSWRFDKSLLEKGVRSNESLEIPPGPNSPVGILWAGLSRPGIGMHGTAEPDTIGRARSAGCIRLSNWDAIRLPTVVRPGANVEIR